MTKAVAYLRVSGASQINGEGFGRQLDTITAWAGAHDYQLVGTYREEAVSGKTGFEDRPAFMSMLADLLSNGCRTIIVERLDRLAREYRVQEQIVFSLMRKQIALISADTGENITEAMNADPMKKAIVQMQGVFAELDKNMLVMKLGKARAKLRARGEYQGGYRAYGHTPGERNILRMIWRLDSAGLSLRQIARELDQAGARPRSGARWQPSTLARLVQRAPEPE